MQVSVVIPTRNRARLLARALRALANQTATFPWEVIVVDDGSADDTAGAARAAAERARRAGRGPLRYLRQDPAGANAARNRGIREASGEVIALSDDDAVAPPGWLEALVGGLLGSSADVAAGPVRVPQTLRVPGRHGEADALLARVDDVRIPLAGNMAVRGEVFKRGLFAPDVRAPVEEREWLERVGAAWVAVPGAWVLHAKDPATVTLGRLMRAAWHRGRASGAFSASRGAPSVIPTARTLLRSLAHAATGCSGGLITAAGAAGHLQGAYRG